MENAVAGELSGASSMIDEPGLSTWKLKNCFVKHVSHFVLWPLFIFMSPGNTELWAVFKGCWHWTLQSTRLIPLLPALSVAPALPSDTNWREAQVEQVTQKLELVLFHCNSVVSDYPTRLMISWLCHIFWFKVGGLLGVLLGPPLGMVFWKSDFSSWGGTGGGEGKSVGEWLAQAQTGYLF